MMETATDNGRGGLNLGRGPLEAPFRLPPPVARVPPVVGMALLVRADDVGRHGLVAFEVGDLCLPALRLARSGAAGSVQRRSLE